MNTAAGLVLDTFKELLWDHIVRATLTKIFVKVPLLGWGPIGYVISNLVFKYSDELYSALSFFIEVKLIVLKNKKLQQEYAAASLRLRQVALSSGIESVEFRKARDEDKDALSKFVRFDVAR